MKRLGLHILPVCIALMIVTAFFGSCKDESKKMVIPEGKMEDVLYDYHLLDGIVRTSNLDSATIRSYVAAVFDKHGITQAEFDSSMVYYMRHTEILEGIYKRLYSRIENEGRLCGVNGTDFTGVSTDANADTANIWNRDKLYVLTEHAPYNFVSFSFKSDSTFRKGDKFRLNFNSDFIQQDGSRNGYAIFTMILQNDSAITRTLSLTSQMDRTMDVEDINRVGVKEVKGYFLSRQSNNINDRNSSTMKFMIISKLALIKMHTPEPIKNDTIETINNDSTENEKNNPSLPESAAFGKHPGAGLHKFHSR